MSSLRSSGLGRALSPTTPPRPARLTPRCDDDPEVKGRAPTRGESWVPPLGPEREGGPLEAPAFDDALDEDDAPDSPAAAESGRASGGGQDDDDGTTGASAGVTEETDPSGDDLLVGTVAPDH